MNRSRYVPPIALITLLAASCAGTQRPAPPTPQAIADAAAQPTPPPKAATPPADPDALPSVHDLCLEDPDAVLMSSGEMIAPPTELQSVSDRLDAVDSDGGDPFVVVHYGDSHTKAASLPRELRDLFGGGPASPGFIAPGHPAPGLWDASVSHSGAWTRHNWLYGRDRPSFGPMGLAYSTRAPGARLRLKLRTAPARGDRARVTIFYKHEAGHLPFRVESGGEVLAEVESAQEPVDDFELGLVEVELPVGARDMGLTVGGQRGGGGEFRFYGALVQYPDAVIEWDAMGIGGTTIRGPVRRSDHTMDTYLNWRDPDMLVFWYGSNSAAEINLNVERYGEEFDTMLARMRDAAPNAACLVIGLPDLDRPTGSCAARSKRGRSKPRRSGRRTRRVKEPRAQARGSDNGRIKLMAPRRDPVENPIRPAAPRASCEYQTVRPLPGMVEVQRAAAERNGCIYFDTYNYMGGWNSIRAWANQKPALASRDMVHLTRTGYRTLARAIFEKLSVLIKDLEQQRALGLCPEPNRPAEVSMSEWTE